MSTPVPRGQLRAQAGSNNTPVVPATSEHSAQPRPARTIRAAGTPYGQFHDPLLSMDTRPNITPAAGQRSGEARSQRAALLQIPHGGATGLLAEWVGPSLAQLLTGHRASPLGVGIDALGLIPPLRGARAVSEAALAYRAAEEGMKAASAAQAATRSYRAGQGVVLPGLRAGGRKIRAIRYNDLTQQLPRSRSTVANAVSRAADEISAKLQPHLHDVPGARIVTAGERVAKAAGREQRMEGSRSVARVAEHLNTLGKLKQGSDEDIAHFWYAQLPAKLRNAEGLLRVRGKQEEELRYIHSGQALDDLNRQEVAVRAKMAEATTPSERLSYLRDLEEIKVHKTDLPQRAQDAAGSIATLGRIAARAPKLQPKLIEAARGLAADRERILLASGKIDPARAALRTGLVSRWLGEAATGEEVYVGHRLPREASGRGSYVPTGGVGRVKTPQGVATENQLVLAKTGRLLPSLHATARDWRAVSQFEQSNRDREILGKFGQTFTGHVPEGHLLVNPKGRTIPKNWRTDELAQFADSIDHELTREQAKEILSGFIASTPAEFERMKGEALAQGVDWSELRVVSKRLVDRYYGQFRALRGRGALGKGYDSAVDAVATSIIFARIGYIPKNLVQNLIVSIPHQGPLVLVNAVRAGQVLADTQLRHLLQGEIGFTGATGALAREGFHLGKIAGGMSKVADDPLRIGAFLHEAAAEGVISRVNPLLNERDHQALLRLLTDPGQRPLLNDIHSRTVEAMADFSRMTPDQAKIARRFLIIPGWLMAGTRYPFHFAVNHPARSALLAYIALGEPGSPEQLQFNRPVSDYFTKGTPSWLEGVKLGDKVLRTGSISPVNTPWDLGQAIGQTVKGKDRYSHAQTVFDFANPLFAAAIRGTQGDTSGLPRLAPNYGLIQGLLHPQATTSYPGDATRIGRLLRETGVVPIPENNLGSTSSGAVSRSQLRTPVAAATTSNTGPKPVPRSQLRKKR